MRYLVTGTAGFIGFHTARRLLADGHQVTGIDGMTAYYDVKLKERRHALLEEMVGFQAHRMMLDDADTRVIALYLESVRRPRRFKEVAAQAAAVRAKAEAALRSRS